MQRMESCSRCWQQQDMGGWCWQQQQQQQQHKTTSDRRVGAVHRIQGGCDVSYLSISLDQISQGGGSQPHGRAEHLEGGGGGWQDLSSASGHLVCGAWWAPYRRVGSQGGGVQRGKPCSGAVSSLSRLCPSTSYVIFFPLSTFAVFLSIHLDPFLSEIPNSITKTFLEIQITMNLFCRVLQTQLGFYQEIWTISRDGFSPLHWPQWKTITMLSVVTPIPLQAGVVWEGRF